MQSIHNLKQKIKGFFKDNIDLIITPLILIIVGISAFFLGRSSQSILDNNNIYIVNSKIGDRPETQSASSVVPLKQYINDNQNINTIKGSQEPQNAVYVASSRGKLYYRIGCGGSTKLSVANKLFFNTKEQAEAKGYTPAKNCAP